MKKIYILTDYHGYYGSKYNATPYRSGFNLDTLSDAFKSYGITVEYVPISLALQLDIDWREIPVLYTSSEEIGYNYKSFIEDVVLELERKGAFVVPKYQFLRANNNKVFMEFLRDELLGKELTGIKSYCFGTLEELLSAIPCIDMPYPCIVKKASGAMSSGVEMARSQAELIAKVKRLSRTRHIKYEIRDYIRSKRPSLKGYDRESLHQGKFVVQNMVTGLDGDWKILVYNDQLYVLNRHIRPGDFRASGSHFNYKAGRDSDIPDKVLDVAQEIYRRLDVPYVSLDMAFNGARACLIEFQCLYFGTSTQEVFSHEYFIKENGKWTTAPKTQTIEELNAASVAAYLKRKGF